MDTIERDFLSDLADAATEAPRVPMKIEWLPLSALFHDPVVNPRYPEKRLPHLRKIAARFDWNSVRVFTVSKRGPDCYAIVNGAGTREMFLRFKQEFAGHLFPCHVIDHGKGKVTGQKRTKAEAKTFGHQGLDAKVQPAQYFHVAAARGVQWVLDLQEVLAQHKFTTAEGGKWPRAVPLPVVLALYDYGQNDPRLLTRTLTICRSEWDGYRLRAAHFMAIALLIATYGSDIDEKRLRYVMGAIDPVEATAKLEKGAYTHVYSLAFGFAEQVLTAYDYEFRGKLLGGERKHKRYIPARSSLTATFDTLLTIWKSAAKKAKDAAIND